MMRKFITRPTTRLVCHKFSTLPKKTIPSNVVASSEVEKPVMANFKRPKRYTNEELDRMSLDEWAEKFRAETIGVAEMDITSISYEKSADRMRELLKTGLLRHDDIIKRPERFFLAHRLLAYHSPQLGPGFWIRFTVHYNLCMGSIVGLGGEKQVALLDRWQQEGKLGCFSLTEKFAGVNSGLIVNTIAEWDDNDQSFILNTPNHGAKKNWISQGLVADKTVVVADLRMNGKSYGPHAFVMDLRKDGVVMPGVSHGDMGKKTIGNDLDNAWIAFENIRLPKSSLLNKYALIDEEGQYQQVVKDMPVFHMIGQRLFTGRVAVAQAALEFRRRLFAMTRTYADSKMCWSPIGEVPLSNIPQLKALYAEAEHTASRIERFVDCCEQQLTKVLKDGTSPSLSLVEAIAVAKVVAVEESIDLAHRLKNEVGSYALMAESGFAQADFLQCCKFAEGDSRILMQKMARDRFRKFIKKQAVAGAPNPNWDEETRLCFELQQAMALSADASPQQQAAAWDEQYERVYTLARSVMARIMRDFMGEGQ